MRIAHLVNPVIVGEHRDLHFQQPITFKTMRKAKEFAKGEVEVEQIAVFYPEDESYIPSDFIKADPLVESAEGKFRISRKLPYFREMFEKLYKVSDADYFVQTNSDICLMPHFYLLVKALIEEGNDSFCINKRIIPEQLKDLPLAVMWSYIGGGHAGYDCFVFRRGIYPSVKIGNSIMGAPWNEATLITSLVAYAKNFRVYQHANATFHLGDRRLWILREYDDYRYHNTNEFAKILKKVTRKRSKKILKNETIQVLLMKLKHEVKTYGPENYSEDCLYFCK